MKAEKFKPKNIAVGGLYWYVHFVTEIVCFFSLQRLFGDGAYLWLFPLIYDALAFVPQALIGYINDKFPKWNPSLAGIVLLAAASASFAFDILPGRYMSLIILCMGNALTHIGGAEETLRLSGGKLSHSAIFVGGGSFGVISGKLLAATPLPQWILIPLALTAIPFVLLAREYRRGNGAEDAGICEGFDYNSKKISPAAVLAISVMIVAVRGYMGYGIPTSWNKTVIQNVMLYVAMGIGKMAGGIAADVFGVRKIAIFSSVTALPFLLAGDRHMFISLIGVMIFSMTMSITLALLVSVLKRVPGLAFGLTTIGLFLGSFPIFFFRFSSVISNCIIIVLLSILCTAAMMIAVRKDEKINE